MKTTYIMPTITLIHFVSNSIAASVHNTAALQLTIPLP